MSESEKLAALSAASSGAVVKALGRSKYLIGTNTVHVRFCSSNGSAPSKFKFNINPNTLSADFELWVCGSAGHYYLSPVAAMRAIYEDPQTYVDRMHPEIRVVSVDASTHKVMYASGGTSTNFKRCFKAKLP